MINTLVACAIVLPLYLIGFGHEGPSGIRSAFWFEWKCANPASSSSVCSGSSNSCCAPLYAEGEKYLVTVTGQVWVDLGIDDIDLFQIEGYSKCKDFVGLPEFQYATLDRKSPSCQTPDAYWVIYILLNPLVTLLLFGFCQLITLPHKDTSDGEQAPERYTRPPWYTSGFNLLMLQLAGAGIAYWAAQDELNNVLLNGSFEQEFYKDTAAIHMFLVPFVAWALLTIFQISREGSRKQAADDSATKNLSRPFLTVDQAAGKERPAKQSASPELLGPQNV